MEDDQLDCQIEVPGIWVARVESGPILYLSKIWDPSKLKIIFLGNNPGKPHDVQKVLAGNEPNDRYALAISETFLTESSNSVFDFIFQESPSCFPFFVMFANASIDESPGNAATLRDTGTLEVIKKYGCGSTLITLGGNAKRAILRNLGADRLGLKHLFCFHHPSLGDLIHQITRLKLKARLTNQKFEEVARNENIQIF